MIVNAERVRSFNIDIVRNHRDFDAFAGLAFTIATCAVKIERAIAAFRSIPLHYNIWIVLRTYDGSALNIPKIVGAVGLLQGIGLL